MQLAELSQANIDQYLSEILYLNQEKKKRMSLRIIIGNVVASLILGGCSIPTISNDLVDKPYFDISGLIEEQVVLLSILNPTLNKSVEKDGRAEVRLYNDFHIL